ncbi:MAG TPA: hypothetical protein VIE90_01670 [Candidatus Binatia bacterium]
MSAVQSPLFEPVHWLGTGFKILDETQVPDRIFYVEVRSVEQALDAVRGMKTRAFGQVLAFLYSGALLARGHPNTDAEELRRRLVEMTQRFSSARPTFDFRGLGSFFQQWFDDLPSGSDPREFIEDRACKLGKRIVRGRLARARLAGSVLPNPARVLTHCNVSGELVALAQCHRALGKAITFIATETRPYLQGTRLTAWELAEAGVSVSVIPDGAVAQVMERGEVNSVIVGADRSAQNGDIINKVGTYPLALMAKEYGVPFYALVQDPRSLTSGYAVPIEQRPAAEVLTFQGQSLIDPVSAKLNARYPAFDVTPAELITQMISFDRIYTPDTFRHKYQRVQDRQICPSERRGKYVLVYGIPPHNQYAFLAKALQAEEAENVLVPEMRPQLWGAKIVAPELLKRNMGATLISDNMMGTLFAQREVRRVCLYYDTLTDEGVSAICGSLLAVRLARLHNVPIELLPGAKPRDIPEDLDASTFLGRNICPPRVGIQPVGAEIVSWSLLKS